MDLKLREKKNIQRYCLNPIMREESIENFHIFRCAINNQTFPHTSDTL